MMRSLPFVTTSILTIGLLSAPVHADTIEITAGTLTLNRTFGQLHVEGPRGFVFDSIIDGSSLGGSIVVPGETVVLTMERMGLPGQFSIDGQTFQIHPITGLLGSEGAVFASVVAPAFDETASVSGPFTFRARIAGIDEPPFPLELVGRGTVQVDFLMNTVIPVWEPQRGVFQFESSDVAPIPEPATLILVGSGIAGCLMRRCRNGRREVESS